VVDPRPWQRNWVVLSFVQERQEILRIHVRQWEQPPTPSLLSHLAEQAVGYCGSDLRALCSEAVIQGLRRRYPQIYKSSQKLLLDPNAVMVTSLKYWLKLWQPINTRGRFHLGHALYYVWFPNVVPKIPVNIWKLSDKYMHLHWLLLVYSSTFYAVLQFIMSGRLLVLLLLRPLYFQLT
jgi:hypothetical protein